MNSTKQAKFSSKAPHFLEMLLVKLKKYKTVNKIPQIHDFIILCQKINLKRSSHLYLNGSFFHNTPTILFLKSLNIFMEIAFLWHKSKCVFCFTNFYEKIKPIQTVPLHTHYSHGSVPISTSQNLDSGIAWRPLIVRKKSDSILWQ